MTDFLQILTAVNAFCCVCLTGWLITEAAIVLPSFLRRRK